MYSSSPKTCIQIICKQANFMTIKKANLWTFKRKFVPPLQKPRESPYIVGPYLKPAYVEREYITEPIKEKHDDDLDQFIYEPKEIPENLDRKVKLILIQDVEGLGTAGQVVDANFRASKLVSMKKAEYFTDFTKNWHKFGPKTMQSASSALSPKTIRGLTNQVFQLETNNRSVKAWHLSVTLRRAGILCPTEAIDDSSIKVEGECVSCTVTINNHEKVTVKFKF